MNKGFEIKCLDCGSTNVVKVSEIDYDYDDNSFISGIYLHCNNCGQEIQFG